MNNDTECVSEELVLEVHQQHICIQGVCYGSILGHIFIITMHYWFSGDMSQSISLHNKNFKKGNLDLLFGEQHVPPLVDLPDESLCFSHTVVALSFPLQMLYLQVIQLGSRESTETSETQGERNRDVERQLGGNQQEDKGEGRNREREI